jgi:3-oxoacyl-[acyl-carrier-protein] synthase-1
MKRANVETEKIDFISAHGTATPYNDDMESIALKRHGLETTPVNSFKGYFGHTLGAAGLIESALSIYSLQNNILFKTLGLQNLGTSETINAIKEHQEKKIKTVLKLGSGFGGSNAALIIKKL